MSLSHYRFLAWVYGASIAYVVARGQWRVMPRDNNSHAACGYGSTPKAAFEDYKGQSKPGSLGRHRL